jgi:hypothetical protein
MGFALVTAVVVRASADVGLGSESVIRRCRLNVRFASESRSRSALLRCRKSARSGCEQMQQTVALFDHLVGAGEQTW